MADPYTRIKFLMPFIETGTHPDIHLHRPILEELVTEGLLNNDNPSFSLTERGRRYMGDVFKAQPRTASRKESLELLCNSGIPMSDILEMLTTTMTDEALEQFAEENS